MNILKKIALIIGLMLCAPLAYAAVTANSYVAPQTPNRGIVQFLQGTDSAGTYKTLYTAGSNGSRCYGMIITSDDTSTGHLMTIQLVNGGIKYGGNSISTPATGPGFANGVPPVAPMTPTNWPGLPTDANGNPYIQMISGDTLQATFATALTAGKLINIYVSCADF